MYIHDKQKKKSKKLHTHCTQGTKKKTKKKNKKKIKMKKWEIQ